MNDHVIARAHGRVNLIGEHTDYNGGWVLPTTIPQYTEVNLEKALDNKVTIISSHNRSFSYLLGNENKTGTWVDYLQGATKFLLERGEPVEGFTARINSTIPEGSGLSSSAALEMSFLKAIRELFKLDINTVDLALMGQRIENEFVGARVGIMDQMAVGIGEHDEALFLDTLNLTYEKIPLPLSDMDLMVINSGISHRLSSEDGGYNQRRAQCEEACRILKVKILREVTLDHLMTSTLPDTLKRRARHVVSENERVKMAANALKEKNITLLGKLFFESHESMKNDYEVSIPEIDLLVNLCLKQKGVLGARLTGGGFGGSIVAITQKGLKSKIAEEVIREYENQTGEKGTLLA